MVKQEIQQGLSIEMTPYRYQEISKIIKIHNFNARDIGFFMLPLAEL